MSARSLLLYFTLLVFFALGLQASAETDVPEAKALQDLYRTLNTPSQLKGWSLDGSDPCAESWTGVRCNGPSVIQLIIPGLQLGGNLGYQLSSLHNLKKLDISSNYIQGEIPYNLPPNATHINLANNNFSQNMPYSLTNMKHLMHLNLSHNSLSGRIGNVFLGVKNLKEMDLSYNFFTGDLPSSFGDLKNLTSLFLENNGLTGSVIVLSNLPLMDLDIRDNKFTGAIPQRFQSIHNLWIGGNRFHQTENLVPWLFPWDSNITSPPESSNTSRPPPPPSPDKHKQRKKMLGFVGIASICAASVFAVVALFAVAFLLQKARGLRPEETRLPVFTARSDIQVELPPITPAPQIIGGSTPARDFRLQGLRCLIGNTNAMDKCEGLCF